MALPTPDDLSAIFLAEAEMRASANALTSEAERLRIVHERLSLPNPEPCPPPAEKLPRVGVVGASTWNSLPAAERQASLALMREAGITDFRLGVPWSSVERRKGVYDFRFYLTLAQEVLAAGLTPLIVTGYTPSFYRREGDQFSAPTDAAVLTAWPSFLLALFDAFARIGVWRVEVWNEQNHAGPPGMRPVLPALYTDMVRIASDAASSVSRHIHLVAGGYSPAPDKLPNALGATKFTEAMLLRDAHAFEYVDEVAVHPYAGKVSMTTGNFWRTHMANVRRLVPAHVPLSATEVGWATAGPVGTKNTEAEQASFIVDAILTWEEAGPIYLFNWKDWGDGAQRDNSQGLCRLDGTLRPAYYAVKELLTA